MSSSSPLRPWTNLPEGLRDLPRKGFVRRPPETHEESLQSEVIYGIDDLSDLLDRAGKRVSSGKPQKKGKL
jgi:hypothetical protein